MDALKELSDLVRARYSIVYVVSHEEGRVEADIAAIGKARGVPVKVWGCSRGFTDGVDHDDVTDPIAALQKIAGEKDRAIYVLRDFHAFLDDPTVRRWVRDLASSLRTTGQTIVLLSPTLKLPADLEKDVAVIDWPLPDRAQLGELFDTVTAQLKNGKGKATVARRAEVIEAALGLTLTEAENVFAKGLVQAGQLDVASILGAKRDVVRKAGVLEFEEAGRNLDEVGGLDELKAWLTRRRKAFSEAAKAFGVDTPRGVIVVGVPGTGKTMCAKATAAAWGMPLLRLDVSRLLGSLVGESEGKLFQAIRTAEAVAPCVLLVDEIEKGLAGAGTDSSGVATRMLGTLLQWMAEKTSPVYVVATANDVSALPPELLRKGRFDEVWFVDLPDGPARAEILAAHLRRRKRDASSVDLPALVTASEGFVGAEIEQAIVEGLCAAFDAGRELETGDILRALKETVPLAQTMEERISALRGWAKGRARSAAAVRKAETAKGGIRVLDLPEVADA